MAKKKAQAAAAPEEVEVLSQPVEQVSDGPIPGTVKIHNRTNDVCEIPLINGTCLRLAPYSKGGKHHISEAIAKKLLPEVAWKMKSRREINIVEEVA